MSLHSTVSTPTLGPIQSPIQWLLAGFSPGVKRLGGQAEHSLIFSAEVKNGGVKNQPSVIVYDVMLN
jgi:hypothetical protein